MGTDTYKILAVDDNPINIKLLERTLKNNHFDVVTATGGKEAVEQAKHEKPDLILLDVLMPGMDGYDTCKELSSIETTSHIPIIFLSAKNETIDKAHGLALGAVDYLTKPFNPVEINARIRSHLKVRKDVIKLQHENDTLRQQLNSLQDQTAQAQHNPAGMTFVDKILPLTFQEKNKYFEFSSKIKQNQPPATTIFLPVYFNMFNLIYVSVGGFKKDYQTAIVQLMLEKYVRGYIQGDAIKNFSEKFLASLFEQLLESFSPDVYDSPFTISLGYINAAKFEFTLLSIHQDTPLIFERDNQLSSIEQLPVYIESKYAPIIRARRLRLPVNSMLVNYINGSEPIGDKALLKQIVPVLKNNGSTDLFKFNEKLNGSLPTTDKDQLTFSIRLL